MITGGVASRCMHRSATLRRALLVTGGSAPADGASRYLQTCRRRCGGRSPAYALAARGGGGMSGFSGGCRLPPPILVATWARGGRPYSAALLQFCGSFFLSAAGRPLCVRVPLALLLLACCGGGGRRLASTRKLARKRE